MDDERRALAVALAEYRHCWPEETAVVYFEEFLAGHPDAFERELAIGHFTGSAWLVSADQSRVLLTHHRKLGLWLQLGGHADGDTNLERVSLREAEEESGLNGLSVEPTIFDLDRHRIPARGADAEHWHYDVRYVVRAGSDDRYTINEESHALAWRPVTDVVADITLDASLRRMANKWLAIR